MFTDVQQMIWDALTEMSGEDVAIMFCNYYGNQLLNDDFLDFLIDEGVLPDYREDDDDDDYDYDGED